MDFTLPQAPTPTPDSQIDAPAALTYWSSTPPTLSGILGGYPQISRTDLAGSRSFLAKLRRGPNGAFAPGGSRWRGGVVDCGAGIGRVSEGFLKGVVDRSGDERGRGVVVVEPVEQFVEVLRGMKTLADGEGDGEGKGDGKGEGRGWLEEVISLPLENWTPKKTYDIFWNQWCLGHLTDRDLLAYLKRIKGWLTPTISDTGAVAGVGAATSNVQSYIVVKENLSTDPEGEDIYDPVDSSVTRTDGKFRTIFKEAGLKIVRTELQTGFPKGLGLYPVRMYALRPVEEDSQTE